VHDILGREVITLVDRVLQAGILHQVMLDASRLSSGIYFYRLETHGNTQVRKFLLQK
jgi:hypothetical protein